MDDVPWKLPQLFYFIWPQYVFWTQRYQSGYFFIDVLCLTPKSCRVQVVYLGGVCG
jgi:hypothetical protein